MKIIIANWKMNPQTLREARNIFQGIKKTAKKLKKVETIICPPFAYISNLKPQIPNLKIGSQNVFYEERGAFTGEISVWMLKDLGVRYAIIGHSERRALGETNEMINKKIKTALKAGLKVIFCVGENERDFEDKYFNFIKNEIDEGLKGIPRKFFSPPTGGLIIAYEPVWAISSAKNAQPDTPESAFRMAVFIRRMLMPIIGSEPARKIPILYGGSVGPENVAGFLQDMQGALVGSKSLNPKDFGEILKIANGIK